MKISIRICCVAIVAAILTHALMLVVLSRAWEPFGTWPEPQVKTQTMPEDDIDFWRYRPSGWPDRPDFYEEVAIGLATRERRMYTRWSPTDGDPTSLTMRILETTSCGFPFQGFECGEWSTHLWKNGVGSPPHLQNSFAWVPFQSEAKTTPLSKAALVIPYKPIWPGFAINTIFYAAIVWFLFAAPGAIRKRVRRKRGQCAACGYSLRGTPHIEKCPECGKPVAVQK